MRVTFYTAVLIVAACSVVFGLDWVSAPMPPMPEAKNIVFVPPPAPRVAAPVTPPPAPTPQSPPAPQVAVAAPPPVQAPAPAAPPAAVPKVKCDIDACAAAYRSFRDSDCTYNPSFGPRRLCTKGDPERYAREHPETAIPAATTPASAPEAPPVAQTSEPGSIMAPEAAPATPAAAPRCNVAACAAAYPRSFRESDCTFNPGTGPRKICEK